MSSQTEEIVTAAGAWAQSRCPVGALSGAVFDRPTGPARLARKLCRGWPNDKDPLVEVFGTNQRERNEASNWLAGTLYGQKRVLQGSIPTAPSALSGFWMGTKGYARSYEGAPLLFEFDMDWCYPVTYGEALSWEIVLLDTYLTPPDPERAGAIQDLAAYTAGAFQMLTNEHARVRLIAPGYRRESLLRVPYQDFETWADLYVANRNVRRVRTGDHCDALSGGKWACPLRAADRCGGRHAPMQSAPDPNWFGMG